MLTELSDKFYRQMALAVMAVLGLLVFLTFTHYGVSWDEELQSQYGQAVYDYYASGFLDHRFNEIFNLYLYGGMFDGLAAFVNEYTPFHVYETRHLLNALVGLLGLWGTWRLGRLIGGGFVGLASMCLLALTPMYYGHMFNNPKDIPFAAGVVWSLYYMAKTLSSYPQIKPSLILKLGFVYGLTLGVRVNGIMFLPLWGLVLTSVAYLSLTHRRFVDYWQAALRLTAVGALVFMIAYIVMLFCWPWAQENPFLNPVKAMIEFSNFPQDVEVLLDGDVYKSTELPWTYVPIYFFVQLPLLQLLLLFSGIFVFPVILSHLNGRGKKASLYLLAMCVLVPLFYAIVRRPALYDAVRHFIFVLPPLSIIQALSLRRVVRSLTQRGNRWLAGGVVGVAGVLVALTVLAMVRLHPYEYIFVNATQGGVKGALGRFEMDYWGSSFKEASEKLQARLSGEGGVPAGTIYKIAICGPWSAATIYLPPNFEPVEADAPADFFLSTTRWNCEAMRDGKSYISVVRAGALLSVIKDLRGTEKGRLGLPNYREQNMPPKPEPQGPRR